MATKNTTTALAESVLQLVGVDPTALGVDDQVRADATPTDDLIESVLRMGVLQPPTVYWDTDREQYIIVIGHRRVGAAIAAGLPSIQVLVRDAAEAKDALRLEQQLVENERRQGLTPADIARGYKDLSLFGLRPEDIAAAVSEKPARVVAAIKAMDSEGARAGLANGIDLEQAALLAEFEDHPTIQAELTKTALTRPANFNSEYEYAKNKAAAATKRISLEEQLRTDDCELVGVLPWDADYWHGNGDTVPYMQGRTLERLEIGFAEHTACPGHAALIVDVNNPERIKIVYVCTDWKAHHPQPTGDDLSPEQVALEQELEKKRAEAREREEAFTANTAARREWLRGFITGRLNQTAGLFDLIADASIGAAALDELDMHAADHIAVYILTGEDAPRSYTAVPLADMLAAGRFTALRVLAADALGTAEEATSTPGAAEYAPRLATAYFQHLTNWGYTLTDLDIEIQAAATTALAGEENAA
jgi:ParB family chromosome partitioning protein